MNRILLDTDIGSDADDAVCLAYLLHHPDCELLGITTVTGQPEKRAALASVLCQAAGVNVPIYPGAECPLQIGQKQTICQQAAALPRWPHESSFPCDQAAEFLKRTIHKHPGEVILLAIGPLTNIAQLFQQDPEIPGLLKGLVMMGGVYDPQSPEAEKTEWNTSGDPHATEVVFGAPLRLHRAIGSDVTRQVVMAEDEIRRRFTHPLLQPVLDFAEIWFAEFFPSITFHDALAAATIFDEMLCRFERGSVQVDMAEHPGRTYFSRNASGPHEVAVEVNAPGYFDHFFRLFGS